MAAVSSPLTIAPTLHSGPGRPEESSFLGGGGAGQARQLKSPALPPASQVTSTSPDFWMTSMHPALTSCSPTLPCPREEPHTRPQGPRPRLPGRAPGAQAQAYLCAVRAGFQVPRGLCRDCSAQQGAPGTADRAPGQPCSACPHAEPGSSRPRPLKPPGLGGRPPAASVYTEILEKAIELNP